MDAKQHQRWTILMGVAALLLLLAACRPAAITAAQPHALYLTNPFAGDEWRPLDPVTLADLPDGQPLPAWLVSADGATAVSTEHTSGRANPDPATTWVVVHNLPGGERTRFHPPVAGLPTGISAGGRRLLWEPFPPPARYPPPVDWYVLDTAGGAVLGHVRDEASACFRQTALLDPAGTHLYCMADPALDGQLTLQPLRLLAYDVASGVPVGEVVVPQATIGYTAGDSNPDEMRLIEPALALSPDGRTLAAVHAGADQVTLIGTATMAVERTFAMQKRPSLLELLGLAARRASAKGIVSGTIRHAVFSADGGMLYVFSEILRGRDAAGEPAGPGLLAVDVARGRVVASALDGYRVQWVRPAPDGSAYAFGVPPGMLGPYEIREDTPSVLWRLDGRALDVLVEREFGGYRGGAVVSSQ